MLISVGKDTKYFRDLQTFRQKFQLTPPRRRMLCQYVNERLSRVESGACSCYPGAKVFLEDEASIIACRSKAAVFLFYLYPAAEAAGRARRVITSQGV